jgi:hypothetical protein
VIDETRARFLSSIVAQIDVERVAEVHLFPAIRQGGMESGVAVLALDLRTEPAAVAEQPVVAETAAAPDDDQGPYADDGDSLAGEARDDQLGDELDDAFDDEPEDDEPAARRPAPRRFTVYTARYRHTLKGPDRGKWEVSVTEEADAPLLTVDAVVRGVQRRSGDLDEIVRLTGEEMIALTATAVPGT